jgi:hypothetical protein
MVCCAGLSKLPITIKFLTEELQVKVTLKAMASGIALSTLLITGIYLGLSRVKASEANSAVKTTAVQVEYVFTSNGIMAGAEPSPLEIVQVTRNDAAVPVGGVFKSDMDLLSNAVIRLKNNSKEKIRTARLAIDWIDPQVGRTFAAMCGLEVSSLATGAEFVGKVTTISAEEMRKGFAIAGRAQQRLLVRVDTIELANDTLWQYGVMHRKDPNSPDGWTRISKVLPNKENARDVQIYNASFKKENSVKPASAFSICAYWKGASAAYPTLCESCGCNIYNDAYDLNTPQPNGFAKFLFDYIPQGCDGNGWWECPGCQKMSIISYTC